MSSKNEFKIPVYSIQNRTEVLTNVEIISYKDYDLEEFLYYIENNVVTNSFYNQVFLFNDIKIKDSYVIFSISEKVLRVIQPTEFPEKYKYFVQSVIDYYEYDKQYLVLYTKLTGGIGINITHFGLTPNENTVLTDVLTVLKLLDMYIINKKRTDIEVETPSYVYTKLFYLPVLVIDEKFNAHYLANRYKIKESWKLMFDYLIKPNQLSKYYEKYYFELAVPITVLTFGYNMTDYMEVYRPILCSNLNDKQMKNLFIKKDSFNKIFNLKCIKDFVYAVPSKMQLGDSPKINTTLCHTNENSFVSNDLRINVTYYANKSNEGDLKTNLVISPSYDRFIELINATNQKNIFFSLNYFIPNDLLQNIEGHIIAMILRKGQIGSLTVLNSNSTPNSEEFLYQIQTANLGKTKDYNGWEIPDLESLAEQIDLINFVRDINYMTVFLIQAVFVNLKKQLPKLQVKNGSKVCVETIHSINPIITQLSKYKVCVQKGICHPYTFFTENVLIHLIHNESIPYILSCLFVNGESVIMNTILQILVFYFSCGLFDIDYPNRIVFLRDLDKNGKCWKEIIKVLN